MLNTDVNLPELIRQSKIKSFVEDMKELVYADGVNRAVLNSIMGRLLLLAKDKKLFNADIFPVKEGDGSSSLYLLSEEADHTFALYVVSELKGNMSPPHDHTTWAVIAGIEGEEINKFYKLDKPPADNGKADLLEYTSKVVADGSGVTLMPNDIHSIHCLTKMPTLNFHFYGKSIEHLPDRKAFNMKLGTYKIFPANPHIHK
jgi:predicted metal-dependent enzyme (double-stranded beta helix superfamily)